MQQALYPLQQVSRRGDNTFENSHSLDHFLSCPLLVARWVHTDGMDRVPVAQERRCRSASLAWRPLMAAIGPSDRLTLGCKTDIVSALTAKLNLLRAPVAGRGQHPRDFSYVNTKMTRLRGRARTGQRLRTSAPFGHWMTHTFIAGLRCHELSAPWVIDGPITRSAFETYVETQLAPTLGEGRRGHPRQPARSIRVKRQRSA